MFGIISNVTKSMETIGVLIFYGSIWVALTWRCFAVTSICKEVAEGKTTKDALSFQLLQAGIFIFISLTILRFKTKSASEIISASALLITGIWYIYSISKAGLQLKKKIGITSIIGAFPAAELQPQRGTKNQRIRSLCFLCLFVAIFT
ncbi:hypothetical protein [Pontiella sp.]|uniref:hypothetical protein n=1 Tax=Pontiella sp. TaxID=2837462 RepID=UPI00356229FD